MNQLIEFANTNPLLAGATLMMLLAVIFYELRLRSQGVFQVSAAEAVQLINRGAAVIDVREAERFAAGHIVDSRNIPAAELIAQGGKQLKKKRPVLLVCDNGTQSGQCAAGLRKAGVEDIFSLKGGLAAWQRDNFPVVSAKT
jgi:rhodanese-related sulfurtransferase